MEGFCPNPVASCSEVEAGSVILSQICQISKSDRDLLVKKYEDMIQLLDQKIAIEKAEEKRHESQESRLDQTAERLNISSLLMAQTRVNIMEKMCGVEDDSSDGLYFLLDEGRDDLEDAISLCAQNKAEEKTLLERKNSLHCKLHDLDYSQEVLSFIGGAYNRANGFLNTYSKQLGSNSKLQSISDKFEKVNSLHQELGQLSKAKTALDTVVTNDIIKKDLAVEYVASLEGEISKLGEQIMWLKIEQSQLLGRAVHLRSKEADFAALAQNNRDKIAIFESSRIILLNNIWHLQSIKY